MMVQALLLLTSVPSSVPVVSISDFTPGASWTWDYTEADGKPWSTERYTVISQKGSQVVLEISSDYGGAQNLKPNTRLKVDVNACLRAYQNPVQKKLWSYSMFSLVGGQWSEFDAPNTLAFEEKFNCNPHVFSKPGEPYLTVFDTRGGLQVFQQKLWRRWTASWFAVEGPAVQVEKDFDTGYVSKLRR